MGNPNIANLDEVMFYPPGLRKRLDVNGEFLDTLNMLLIAMRHPTKRYFSLFKESNSLTYLVHINSADKVSVILGDTEFVPVLRRILDIPDVSGDVTDWDDDFFEPWKHYVTPRVRFFWDTFSESQKKAIQEMANHAWSLVADADDQ